MDGIREDMDGMREGIDGMREGTDGMREGMDGMREDGASRMKREGGGSILSMQPRLEGSKFQAVWEAHCVLASEPRGT